MIVFTFAFALLIVWPPLLMFMISRFSGWSRMAARYPGKPNPPKALTIFGYGVLRGWFGYNGGLVVSADDEGLHLSTWPFILAWHAPVFIPWGEIKEARARRVLWSRYYELDLRGEPGLGLGLRQGTFALIRPWSDKAGIRVAD